VTEPTNAEAFVNAAEKVTKAADRLDPPAPTVEQRISNLTNILAAIASVLPAQMTPSGMAQASSAATTTKPQSSAQSAVSDLPPITGQEPLPSITVTLAQTGVKEGELFQIGGFLLDDLERWFFDIVGTIAGLLGGLSQIGIIKWRPLINYFNWTNQQQPLSPADCADMVERNILDFDTAAGEAALSGLDPTRFANLVQDTGEPPGIVEMLSLLRRGLIDEDTFAQAVAYSRVKTQYLPQLLQLAYSSMSPADAVEAYVKGIVTEPEAKTFYEHGGGLASQWGVLSEAAGDAIGVERACALEAHGDISADELKKVILRSRINPMFEGIAALGNNRWLSAYQIGTMLSTGAATPQQATLWLTQDGYPSDQVAALVAAKSGQGIHKTKQEALSTILTGYEAGWLTPGQATEGIEGLGYPAEAVPALLALHDNRRIVATMDAAVTRVRAAVLARKIDWTKARAELASIGISAGVINHYVQLWQIEMDTEVRTLTSAQIGSLARKGHITEDVAKQKWVAMGYSQDDAGLLWMEYQPSAASLKAARPAPAATS